MMKQTLLMHVLLFLLVAIRNNKAVTLHAAILNQRPEPSIVGESSNQSQNQQPPMKISTGRLKPISSPASPRYQQALRDIHGAFRHTVKAVSHVGILPDSRSPFQYPKISVKPGRQDSNVISFFHHPAEHPIGGGPYQYLQQSQSDSLLDINQPAKRYRIGQHKANLQSEEAHHASNMISEMQAGDWHQPKAALVHSLPGDARAKSKRPTISANPGKLFGNLVTVVYGPPSSTKKALYITLLQTVVFGLSLKITDEDFNKATGRNNDLPNTTPPTPPQGPLNSATHRMVASTGPSSPRLKENLGKIRNENSGSVKGVSLTGILKNSKSTFLYPKITTSAGKEKSYVLNMFHSPFLPQTAKSRPNMHMHSPQADHPIDLREKAKFYQIGHIRARKNNKQHIKRINDYITTMKNDAFSPKAAMIHYMPANPNAPQKLPSVEVDAGKFDGNLVSIVFGASTSSSKGAQLKSGNNAWNSQREQPDKTIDMLSRVGKSKRKSNSSDSKGKRARVE